MKRKQPADTAPASRLEKETTPEGIRWRLIGSFTVHDPEPPLPADSGAAPGGRVTLDGSGITRWDNVLIVRLERLRGAVGGEVDLRGFPPAVERLLGRLESDSGAAAPAPPRENVFVRIGDKALAATAGLRGFLLFLGETATSLGRLVRGKAVFQRADFVDLFWENSGRSVGIVFLISILTGLIMAFVGAIQLSKFGANIFVADLVAIAMFREMGAMMTGIILAGRTGSAFAAQIGSMKTNDELNALQTMGISSFDFIVLPRLATLALMMPVLAFLASLSGILGGMCVSVGFMDLTAAEYLNRTSGAITASTFVVGILKSVVFGGIIALTGCYKGMAAGSSAEAVGRAATSAVVTSIVLIILADAVFAVLFNIYGL